MLNGAVSRPVPEPAASVSDGCTTRAAPAMYCGDTIAMCGLLMSEPSAPRSKYESKNIDAGSSNEKLVVAVALVMPLALLRLACGTFVVGHESAGLVSRFDRRSVFRIGRSAWKMA